MSEIVRERKEKWSVEKDLLGGLVNLKDETRALPGEDIATDNIIGMLFAAQDTTASALTWILKYLSDNSKLLEAVKVRAPKLPTFNFASNSLLNENDLSVVNDNDLFCRPNKLQYMNQMREENFP